MESLLSLAFDHVSSFDPTKVRKGLRQVDGLLAQICLSRGTKQQPQHQQQQQTSVADKRISALVGISVPGSHQTTTKPLGTLKEDPAFREFFKLQDGFEWNVAHRLITCLDRLLGRGTDGQNDLLILSTLDLIQGLLLLHPPSRALFAREQYMNLLLDLLEPSNCPAIQSSTLTTLLVSCLDHPSNIRTFELLDGLLAITSLFKQRGTGREVKIKLIEFLYFYLMPEVGNDQGMLSPGGNARVVLGRGPGRAGNPTGGKKFIRTTEEKKGMLGRFLPNVDAFMEELGRNTPFGNMNMTA